VSLVSFKVTLAFSFQNKKRERNLQNFIRGRISHFISVNKYPKSLSKFFSSIFLSYIL